MRYLTAKLIYFEGQFSPNLVMGVEGDTITGIWEKARFPRDVSPKEIEDWGNVALLPGTVNAHNHSFQSLLKGIGDGLTFLDWRDKVLYPYAKRLDREAIYTGALMAFGEMLRSGITTVCDFFYIHDRENENARAVIGAAEEIGIRLVLARCMYDWKGAPDRFIESVEEARVHTDALRAEFNQNASHPLILVLPAPHSPHGACAEMIRAGSELSKEWKVPFHIHVAEGKYEVEQIRKNSHLSPLEYLDSLGALHDKTVIIHGVWLAERDIALMKEKGVSLVYNPSSNMFLGDGVTPIVAMRKEGVRLALGTDGGCTNNHLSIFEEMRMSSLLQKVTHLNGSICPARETFEMGTQGGASVLGLGVGELGTGKKADWVALDLEDISLQPPTGDLVSHIVYSMQLPAISRVVVGGKEVMRNGELLNIRFAQIVDRVRSVVGKW